MNPLKKTKEPKQLDFCFEESCPYCKIIKRLREKREAEGWTLDEEGAGRLAPSKGECGNEPQE